MSKFGDCITIVRKHTFAEFPKNYRNPFVLALRGLANHADKHAAKFEARIGEASNSDPIKVAWLDALKAIHELGGLTERWGLEGTAFDDACKGLAAAAGFDEKELE